MCVILCNDLKTSISVRNVSEKRKYDGLLICLSETRAMGVAYLKIVMVKVLLLISFYVEPIVLFFKLLLLLLHV
jgi:hypothetical protein